MDSLGIGLISCGTMGCDIARQLVKIPTARLITVCDADETAARRLANEISSSCQSAKIGKVTYDLDYRRLLESKDVDAVCIASPPFLHLSMALDSASAGKQIYCEKPLAIRVGDCDAILAAVQKARVKLMVGHVLRYYPVHRKIKELATNGNLGHPLCMTVYRLGGGWGSGERPWRKDREKCGGALLEINVHEIDFMRLVCGEIDTVQAVGNNYVSPQLNYEDVVVVLLRFRNGSIGSLHASIVSALDDYGGRLDLTRGSVTFPALWGNQPLTVRRTNEKKSLLLPVDDRQLDPPLRQQMADFVDAVLADREPPITGRDGRAAVAIAEAAYESITTGEPVKLSA